MVLLTSNSNILGVPIKQCIFGDYFEVLFVIKHPIYIFSLHNSPTSLHSLILSHLVHGFKLFPVVGI